MAARLKILHVITGLSAGGAQSSLYALIRHLPELEHEVVALKDTEPVGSRLRALGVPVHGLSLDAPARAGAGARALWRTVRRRKPDWVHTWLYHADFVGGLCGRACGVPVLWHLHVSDLDPHGVKRSTRWIAARCAELSAVVPTRIVACSDASARVHRRMGYAALEVIDNGVDVARFRPGAPRGRESLGLSHADFVVGMVARYDPQKDVETFLRAAVRLREHVAGARFVLVGAGMDETNAPLGRRLRELGLEGAVSRLGYRPDVETLYPLFDVFSLSSVSEASSMSLLEAMACETIPIVTDAGDAARVVGDTGFVVPRRSPEALADGWIQIASESTESRRRRGRAARARVVEAFSAEVQAQRFRALYAG